MACGFNKIIVLIIAMNGNKREMHYVFWHQSILSELCLDVCRLAPVDSGQLNIYNKYLPQILMILLRI